MPNTTSASSFALVDNEASASLGAQLAATSRAAQGFVSTVVDPLVVARLQELCLAPLPWVQTVMSDQEGTARVPVSGSRCEQAAKHSQARQMNSTRLGSIPAR